MPGSNSKQLLGVAGKHAPMILEKELANKAGAYQYERLGAGRLVLLKGVRLIVKLSQTRYGSLARGAGCLRP